MERRVKPLTWLAVALIVAIGLMAVFGAVAMTTYGGYYGMMGGSWGWGLVMMAVPVVILVLILAAALGGLERSSSTTALPPIAILDERYARGEVTREDYLRARDDLGSGRTHT